MAKYFIKGTQGHVILTADSNLAAGSDALRFNLGSIISITEVKKDAEKKTAKARTRTDTVPKVPFEFPEHLRS